MKYRLFPLGDCAITIEFGEHMSIESHQTIQSLTSFLDDNPPNWMVEYVSAYTTLTLYYDPMKIPWSHSKQTLPYVFVCEQLNRLLSTFETETTSQTRTVEIPVCYGGEFGPDLNLVANVNHLTIDEVIQIHTSNEYLVYMIGFAPGFPYLGGMSEIIATPRKETPRLTIPSQSVGIAGKQTGIYPIETPGGWQIIGRTPFKLFRPNENPPTLLKAGDKVCFRSISLQEYLELEETE